MKPNHERTLTSVLTHPCKIASVFPKGATTGRGRQRQARQEIYSNNGSKQVAGGWSGRLLGGGGGGVHGHCGGLVAVAVRVMSRVCSELQVQTCGGAESTVVPDCAVQLYILDGKIGHVAGEEGPIGRADGDGPAREQR